MSSDREPDDPLDPIVVAIVEGTAVDWSAAEDASHLSDEDRELLEPFRILAAIASQGREASGREDGQPIDNRFELRGLIGSGAFGEVHRAWDRRLQREVALKIVALDRPFATSVLEEARRLASIRHPGVVTVHDVFDDGVTGRICMELLTGRTLDAMVRESGVFSIAGAAEIGQALCNALGAIHDAGIIHGDVKARNVLVEVSGRVVLMDLGAGARSEEPGLPAREGTPLYMAPELFAAQSGDTTSDIFSLGVLLYYLVTGGHPVSGRTVQDVRVAVERGEAARAALLHVPPPLNRVLARALDVQPGRRFSSARAMSRAISAALTRTRRLSQAVLLVAVALGMGLIVWSLRDTAPGASRPGISVRQIVFPPDFEGVGDISSDGELLTFSDETRGVKLLHLRTGRVDTLAASDQTGRVWDRLMFRPGHETVLYGWKDHRCECFQIREVPISGGAPRVLASGFAVLSLDLTSVSGDGSRVLVRLGSARLQYTVAIVGLDDGRQYSLGAVFSGTQVMNLSPDARFIVHDGPASPTDLAGDLYLIDTATGESRPLLSGKADDSMPLWGQEGRDVYFSSDRAGVPSLWRLSIDENGRPGEPSIVHRDLGRFMPVTMTSRGLLFWTTPVLDIETAPFDALAGRVTGPPRTLPVRVAASSYAPEWSPDGRRIAYASERSASGAARAVLVIHSVETGEEREIRVPVNGYLNPAWSPDASRLIIRGPGALDKSRGARVLDIASGVLGPATGFGVGGYAWSPNGQSVYFATDDGIKLIDMKTMAVTAVPMAGPWFPQGVVVSPDGASLAVNATDDTHRAIVLLDPTSGRQRVLSAPPETVPTVWAWTPDGSRLLGTRPRDVRDPEVRELVTVSVESGRIESTGFQRPGLTSVSLRPDGNAIAYRKGSGNRTLWLVEGLRPPRSSDE